MNVPTATKRFEFDSAHRVLGHAGKCRFVHGHHYVAEVTLSAEALNSLGMVVDFSDIKDLVGRWINEFWDHNIILHPEDLLLDTPANVFGGKLPYVMPEEAPNPTVENMAMVLFGKADSLCGALTIRRGVKVSHVRLYETPGCWADYSE